MGLIVAGPIKKNGMQLSTKLDALDEGISTDTVQRQLGTTTMKYLRGWNEY